MATFTHTSFGGGGGCKAQGCKEQHSVHYCKHCHDQNSNHVAWQCPQHPAMQPVEGGVFTADKAKEFMRDFFNARGFGEKTEDYNFRFPGDENKEPPTQKEKHATLLGVSVDATHHEIKVAFHKMALKYHPDKWTYERTGMTREQGEERFKSINEANEFLTNN